MRRVLPMVALFGVLSFGVVPASIAAGAPPDVDAPGPYSVGYLEFDPVLSGDGPLGNGLARAWYPAAPDTGTALEVYLAADVPLYLPLVSVHENADPAIAGPFPIVVQIGGGDGFVFAQLAERFASHGFVYVTYDNNVNPGVDPAACLTQSADAAATLDALRTVPGLGDAADFDRVGLTGHSAYGSAAFNIAGGNPGLGIEPLPGVGAVTAYESDRANCDAGSAGGDGIAALFMGGSEWDFRIGPGDGVSETEAAWAASSARPKYFVDRPASTHLSYTTNTCQLIDGLLRSSIPDLNTLGWVLLNLDLFSPLIEGFRMTCNDPAYPVASSFFDLSDYPVPGVIPIESASQAADTIHFALAFNLVHLAGDGRYQHLLTSGYVNATADDSNEDGVADASLRRTQALGQ